jgi:hypothetical protein
VFSAPNRLGHSIDKGPYPIRVHWIDPLFKPTDMVGPKYPWIMDRSIDKNHVNIPQLLSDPH